MRVLRASVTAAITSSGHADAEAVTGTWRAWHAWYSDPLNSVAVALLGRDGTVNRLIMRAYE